MGTSTGRSFGRLAVAAIAWGLWSSAIAGPTWDEVANDLRATLPADSAAAIVDQAKKRHVPPESVQVWAIDIQRARQAGIPAVLLGERLMQGLVKGIPSPRIGQALSGLQANLAWAKRVIDQHAAKAEIRDRPDAFEQAARQLEAALRTGFKRDDLERLFGDDSLTLDQIAGLAGAAGNLRTLGVEPERALRTLAQAGGAGMTADELENLERRFAAGIAAGRPAERLLVEFEQGIRQFMQDEMRQEQMRDFKDSLQDFKDPSQETAPGPSGGGPGGAGGLRGY